MDFIKNNKVRLKPSEQGTLVRTLQGEVYRERLVGQVIVRELVEKNPFIPIESAPDPEVCRITDDGIFLGSQDAAMNLKDLESNNITHILNVGTGIPNGFPQKFTYCNVEILDLDETTIVNYFPKCFSFIEDAISKRCGILIHCNAGVSRSASIVIGFLMENRGMSYQQAFDWVKTKRPKIQPNRGFIEQLKLYGERTKD